MRANPHPAFGTPLPRAGEGTGVRARRAALAMSDVVRFALHTEMVATLSGDRLRLREKTVPWFWFSMASQTLADCRRDSEYEHRLLEAAINAMFDPLERGNADVDRAPGNKASISKRGLRSNILFRHYVLAAD